MVIFHGYVSIWPEGTNICRTNKSTYLSNIVEPSKKTQKNGWKHKPPGAWDQGIALLFAVIQDPVRSRRHGGQKAGRHLQLPTRLVHHLSVFSRVIFTMISGGKGGNYR